MRKFFIILLFLNLALPSFSLQTPDEQIKSALEEEKAQEKTEKTDYKKEYQKVRSENSRASTGSSVSAGKEHAKSKYMAQVGFEKNKKAFEKRKNLELRLMRGQTVSKEEERELLDDEE